MSQVTNTIYIRANPGEVFDLVTTAKYWTQWHPATVSVSGQVENPMRIGDVIRERARIGGIEAENDWTVIEWEPLRYVVLSMPHTRLGNLTIRYEFTPVDSGVNFSRELVYDASGFPFEIRARIEQQMASDSQTATERIKQLVEEQLDG